MPAWFSNSCTRRPTGSEKPINPYEPWRRLITKIHANLVFQACISFLFFCEESECMDMLKFPISFTGVYLVFEVFQTRVAHFCLCLVRIKCHCSYVHERSIRKICFCPTSPPPPQRKGPTCERNCAKSSDIVEADTF